MTDPVCPRCGTPSIPQSTVCSSCGASLLSSPTVPPVPRPGSSTDDSGDWRVFGYPESGGPTSESLTADRAALSDISAAAMIAVFSFLVSLLVVGVSPALTYLTDIESRASTAGNATGLGILVGTLLFAVVLSLVEFALFRRSFQRLARFDPIFRGPGTFAVVAMVGLVVLGALAVTLAVVVAQVNRCTGGNPFNFGQFSCGHAGEFLLLLGVLLVGAAVTLIGYIGVAVGIWRLGAHCDVELFKLAAILLLVVSIVGAIVLWVAVRAARRRTAPTPSPFS